MAGGCQAARGVRATDLAEVAQFGDDFAGAAAEPAGLGLCWDLGRMTLIVSGQASSAKPVVEGKQGREHDRGTDVDGT